MPAVSKISPFIDFIGYLKENLPRVDINGKLQKALPVELSNLVLYPPNASMAPQSIMCRVIPHTNDLLEDRREPSAYNQVPVMIWCPDMHWNQYGEYIVTLAYPFSLVMSQNCPVLSPSRVTRRA